MPLARGYSRAVVSHNIAQEMNAGRSQAQSVAIALSSARRSYRSRHPVGPFPRHLRMSATYRASRSMNRAGAPALTPPTMVSSLIDLGVRPDATVFYSVKQGYLHASERDASGRIGRPRKLAWARVPGYDPRLFYYVEKGLLYASARSSSVASRHEARIAREDAGMPRAMRDVMSSRNRASSIPVLPVMFRVDKRKVKGEEWRQEVQAVFPTEPGTRDPWTVMVYAHNGQHGTGDWSWVQNHTRPATPAEYGPLLAELRRIYSDPRDGAAELKVVHRASQAMQAERRKKAMG